jgi:hypothetical protein
MAVGEDRKAKPSRDYVVKAYPAQITVALSSDDLTLQQRMPCGRKIFQIMPKGSIPEKPEERGRPAGSLARRLPIAKPDWRPKLPFE